MEERVRQVLLESGLDQNDFARSIGLDAPKLSKSLAGKRRFTSLELARVAEVGGCSVDWIITGRDPFRPVFARRARFAEADDQASARLVERVVAAVRGLDELGSPLPSPELPVLGQRTGWFTKDAPRLAKLFADRVDDPIGGMPFASLVAAIERCFGVIVVVADLPPGVDGLSYEDNDAQVILVATTTHPLRQRFTLAHELAHIAFGDARKAMLEERMDSVVSTDEKRANTFAAAFLAPAAELREFFAQGVAADVFARAVAHFQLSPDALAWRLCNEQMIDDAQRRPLAGPTARAVFMQLGMPADWSELVNESQQPRPTWALLNAYLDLYRSGDTTAKPLAKLLGWGVAETEEYFALDEFPPLHDVAEESES